MRKELGLRAEEFYQLEIVSPKSLASLGKLPRPERMIRFLNSRRIFAISRA